MAAENSNATVGFIGLGSQGGPMAQRIIEAGHPTLLWARRPETLQPFLAAGAQAAASLADLGARSTHVGICVVDDASVRQICEALIPAMQPGGRIAIHATIHPNTCLDLAAQAKARGLSLIDAPVSGGGPAAAAGKLTVMVGGDEAALAAARPIFEAFAGLIVHLGGAGAGQTAKLVNNALMAAHMGLAHHALHAGEHLGLDRAALADLIKQSSGRSFGFEVFARLPNPAAFSHGAALLAKDVGLLGDVLSGHPSFTALRDVAAPFFDLVSERASS